MTVVYLDALFLLNFVLDYLLLLVTAKAAGAPFARFRLALGALVGAGYAAVCCLPGLAFLALPPVKLCGALVMVLTAFGGQDHLLRMAVLFLALSCALGGGVLAVTLLGGTGMSLSSGIPASGMDLKVVLLAAAGSYLLLTVAAQRIGRHTQSGGELVPVTLELAGRRVELTALLDTGNTLTDPAGNRAVLVAEAEAVRPLMPPGAEVTPGDLREPVDGLERLSRLWGPGRFRLLPYRAVGVSCGMLLALRVDRAEIGGRSRKGMLVALSPGPVSDGGSYRALVGVS